MHIKKYKNPWPHFEVNTFLNKQQLKVIKEYTNYYVTKNKKNIDLYRRFITPVSKNNTVYSILYENFKNLLKITFNLDIHKFYFETSLSICTSNFDEHHIHTDVPTKKISGIFFLSKEGNGTELYKSESEDSLKKNIAWKPNKLFLFKRTNYSWHNFNSIGNEDYRIVYNLNLNKILCTTAGGIFLKKTNIVMEN